ncbi:helix-turn-helix domain-containing protein [Streptomyces sp. ITFR-16]|uniref:TetR/AcrR family transcriptional regulator n=1 Tax=Streptomyces sp. ITFR-16 TaxID=3075198 RepID=UPI00288C485F|nr:helix-turn-helix domain-containing protein [Streptomyces sp. ITFR-16]WNI27275.1 helix-turn-helix domain-containing protein [Streptomyces sp. ITFR-16]
MPDTTAQNNAAPTLVGRRERKKAATRQAIADAALRLFLERGYNNVGIREIADAADVSTATLFKHFAVKEALVFDREADLESGLLAAVRERPAGQSVPDALREHALHHRRSGPDADPRFSTFLDLVNSTPALRDYHQAMWLRHTAALASAIAEDDGLPADDPSCTALAHFALEAPHAARTHSDPDQVVTAAFDLLDHGWHALTRRRSEGTRAH